MICSSANCRTISTIASCSSVISRYAEVSTAMAPCLSARSLCAIQSIRPPPGGTAGGYRVAQRMSGLLIVNADDWGGERRSTEAIQEAFDAGRVTSTTAMVYMEDSGRAAEIAR